MTVYVDSIRSYGEAEFSNKQAMKYGKQWCHMISDAEDLEELHLMAQKIGLKKSWFQENGSIPHYDLTPNKRRWALLNGASELKEEERLSVTKKIRENWRLKNGR